MREVSDDEMGMSWARYAAAKSGRPVRVGAAMMGDDNEFESSAWNKLPSCLSEAADKYSRTIHAEILCILNALQTEGSTLYVTCPVCHHCAPIVIHAGISRVVTLPPPDGLADWYEASFAAARAMFAEAGVEVLEVAE